MGAIPARSAWMPGPAPPAVPGVRAENGSRPGFTRPAGPQVTDRDVRLALATLSAEQRRVIVEMHYHRRSVAEIAGLLSITAPQVVLLASTASRALLRAVARRA
jgi:DNA-directed RNA polymerase specialized sigma24 family protein